MRIKYCPINQEKEKNSVNQEYPWSFEFFFLEWGIDEIFLSAPPHDLKLNSPYTQIEIHGILGQNKPCILNEND